MKKSILLLVLALFCGLSFAQKSRLAQCYSVHLKNGSIYRGTIQTLNPSDNIKLETLDQNLIVIEWNQVDSITKTFINYQLKNKPEREPTSFESILKGNIGVPGISNLKAGFGINFNGRIVLGMISGYCYTRMRNSADLKYIPICGLLQYHFNKKNANILKPYFFLEMGGAYRLAGGDEYYCDNFGLGMKLKINEWAYLITETGFGGVTSWVNPDENPFIATPRPGAGYQGGFIQSFGLVLRTN